MEEIYKALKMEEIDKMFKRIDFQRYIPEEYEPDSNLIARYYKELGKEVDADINVKTKEARIDFCFFPGDGALVTSYVYVKNIDDFDEEIPFPLSSQEIRTIARAFKVINKFDFSCYQEENL